MRARVGAAGVAAVLLLAGCYQRAEEVAQLMRRHETAVGRVVALECSQDGRWWYEFEAAGKRWRGPASDRAGCARRKLGAAVTVYYDPAAPAVNRAIAPAQAYAAERGFHMPLWLWFGLGALALPLSALMALRRGSRR